MNLLAVSDIESSLIYSSHIKQRFHDIDLAISCGDLSYYYLEYIISTLDIPLYFVRGNHAKKIEYGCTSTRHAPWGAVELHQQVIRDPKTQLLLAGIEGCLRYNRGNYQYSQQQMWRMVLKLVPQLLLNKARYGRYLDIFVTHAPPWDIHDKIDPAHQGVKAFKWLINTFHPAYHLHGHVHVYRPDTITETQLGKTRVINSFGYRRLGFQVQTSLQTATDKSLSRQ